MLLPLIVFSPLNEGTVYSLTCLDCFGDECTHSNNSCTVRDGFLCFLRIIIHPSRNPSVDYGCNNSPDFIINNGIACNNTFNDGSDVMHLFCCDNYDYCNEDIMHTIDLSPNLPAPTSTLNVTGK